MNKFYMVFVEGSNGCKYMHSHEADAEREAERLARMECNIRKHVFVLEAKRFCIVEPTPVTWDAVSETEAQDIPF